MTFPYRFINTPSEELGTGVSDKAFLQTGGWPLTSRAGNGGFMVRQQLNPLATTPQIYAPHLASLVGATGTSGGIQQAGQLTLAALSDYVKQRVNNGPS